MECHKHLHAYNSFDKRQSKRLELVSYSRDLRHVLWVMASKMRGQVEVEMLEAMSKQQLNLADYCLTSDNPNPN